MWGGKVWIFASIVFGSDLGWVWVWVGVPPSGCGFGIGFWWGLGLGSGRIGILLSLCQDGVGAPYIRSDAGGIKGGNGARITNVSILYYIPTSSWDIPYNIYDIIHLLLGYQ